MPMRQLNENAAVSRAPYATGPFRTMPERPCGSGRAERLRSTLNSQKMCIRDSLTLAAALGLASCNTISGIGKDVEAMGSKIDNASQATRAVSYTHLDVYKRQVTARAEAADLGVTQLTLSNGVCVNLKPTEFDKDSINITSVSYTHLEKRSGIRPSCPCSDPSRPGHTPWHS